MATLKTLMGPKIIDFLSNEGFVDEQQACNLAVILQSRLYFGVVALREGFITPEQLETALIEQERTGSDEKIGELLLRKGYISRGQIDSILSLQENETMPNLELLCELGIIPFDMIDEITEKYENQAQTV